MSGAVDDLRASKRPSTLRGISRREFLAGVGSVAAGLTLDAGIFARHDYVVVERPLKIARLPEAFHGFRFVQLSDIHLEEFTEATFLRLIVHRINELKPELVLLTGDFGSLGPLPRWVSKGAIDRCASLLKNLACPLRFGILGNHDVGIGASYVVGAMEESGIRMLVNRHVPIERQGQRIWIGGVDDAGTSHPILDLAIPRKPDGPVILMSHPPDYADEVVAHPRGSLVDVMLSGHSHGGQIRLPFIGPVVLPPMGEKYVAGLYRFNQMQLYVNRGIGTVGLPFRLNCPPEITVHTLQPAG